MKSSESWFLFVSSSNILYLASKPSLCRVMHRGCHLIKLLCTLSGPFVYVWTWTLSCFEKPVEVARVSKQEFLLMAMIRLTVVCD